jgi:osmotically-inducible protein OsmY
VVSRDCSDRGIAQNGRGVKRITRRLGELFYCLAARNCTFCAIEEKKEMRRFLSVATCTALLTLAGACSRSDEAKAKQEARDLGHKINQAVNSGGPAQAGTTQSAEEKLRQGGQDLRVAGEKAGVKLDHAALIAQVKTKLATDISLSTATSIAVEAYGHVITLRGTVPSAEQKHEAEQVASQVEGVTKVVNNLRVQP